MNIKKILTGALAVAVSAALFGNHLVKAEDDQATTVVDWRFGSRYIKEGTTLAGNDLVLKDASGNGNDLVVETGRMEEGRSAADYMDFVNDSIDGQSQSLFIHPKSTDKFGKKTGAFFRTVDDAPVNAETFDEGYTFEFIVKISDQISDWGSILSKRGTGKMSGLQSSEPQSGGGLNVSGSGELQWNFFTNNRALHDNPTTWSDAGGMQPDKFHHIVVKNDTNFTTMIVDGIPVLRNNTTPGQRGLFDLGHGWAVGSAYWSEAESFSEKTCGDAIFQGEIQQIRMSKGLVSPKDYLVTEHTVDDAYNVEGNNIHESLLQDQTHYNFAVIPDPQYTTQYKPAILDAQNEWIVKYRDDLNIAMTLGVGDVTQDSSDTEFAHADRSYSVFDKADLPYLLADGNHDSIKFLDKFGPARYANNSSFCGAGPSGYSKYAKVNAGSYRYMFVTIPYNQEQLDQDREWLNQILTENKNVPTVIVTHFDDGTKNITNDFVKKYDQVFMFLEGHVTYRDASVMQNDYGHPVINAIVNYQFEPYGGNGVMRLMEFDEAHNKIVFHSYSPWVEKKMDILNGTLENNDILTPDEMSLFPFDCLNIKEHPSDTASFDFNFAQRFAGMERSEKLQDSALHANVTAAEEVDLAQYYDGKAKDDFRNALGKAKDVLDRITIGDAVLDQKTVDQAALALAEARSGLQAKVDVSRLQDLLEQTAGLKQDVYTEESWQVFADVVAKAQDLVEDSMSKQEDVDAAYMSLVKAAKGLVKQSHVDDLPPVSESKLEEDRPVTGVQDDPLVYAGVLALALGSLLLVGKKR